jgi:hypothetical protein
MDFLCMGNSIKGIVYQDVPKRLENMQQCIIIDECAAVNLQVIE